MGKNRFILVVTLCATAILLIAASFTLVSLKKSFAQATKETVELARDITHQSLIEWVNNTESYVSLLAKDENVITLTAALLALTDEPDTSKKIPIQHKLNKLITSTVEFNHLIDYSILSPDHQNIASSSDPSLTVKNPILSRPVLLEKLWQGQTVTTAPQPSIHPVATNNHKAQSQFPIILVGTPIRGADNRIVALLIIKIDARNSIQQILSRARLGKTGETYLVNGEGYMISQSRYEKALIEQGRLTPATRAEFNINMVSQEDHLFDSIRLDNIVFNHFTAAFQGIKTGKAGSNLNGYLDYRNITVIGAWLWDPELGYGIISEQDFTEAFTPYHQSRINYLIFTVATLIIIYIFALLFAKINRTIIATKQQLKSLWDNNTDPAFLSEPGTGKILKTNQQACQLLHYPITELTQLHLQDLYSAQTKLQAKQDMLMLVKLGSLNSEAIYQSYDGNEIPVEITSKQILFGDSPKILTTLKDLRPIKDAELKQFNQAIIDHLTGLGNRTAFESYLEKTLMLDKNSNDYTVLYFIDLDEFRVINDSLGHRIGDTSLQLAAKRITSVLPKTARAFRFGGDEFTVVASFTNLNQKIPLGELLHSVFKAPFIIAENHLHIRVSIGIACAPQDGDSATYLLQSADSALFAGKKNGRNQCFNFTPEMRSRDQQHLAISNALVSALKNDEFYLVYQPVVNAQTEELIGAEVLLRWRNEKLGLVPPDLFIPVAEHNGRIIDIGNWILQESCKTLSLWQRQGLSRLRLSINLSPVQLLSEDIYSSVMDALNKYQLLPNSLALEITEGVIMENNSNVLNQLTELTNQGIYLYLDDFGTGYSSLSYLNNYPFNIIKIDKCFVQNVAHSQHDQALVKTVLTMAEILGMQVIAEGVEEQAQIDYLREQGCNSFQGYFYGKPLESDDFMKKWHISPK